MNICQNLGSNPSLKQLVYETLQNQIILGQLEPGQKLTEDELAQSMNISRAPIREALNMLDRDGFTKSIPRKGTVVAPVSRKYAIDIWNCRLALEPYAAKIAMPNIPREEIEAAMENVLLLENSAYDFDRYISSDLEVHQLYYTHLDNEYLKNILDNLKAHSVRVRWLREVKQSNHVLSQTSIREHRQILEALLAQDAETVYKTVEEHIRNSGVRLMETLD